MSLIDAFSPALFERALTQFKLKLVVNTICFLFVSLFVNSALALTSGITYHGRLLEPDGITPVTGPVTFTIQIRTPNSANCIMYAESQALNLASSGVFALTIGEGTPTATMGLTLDEVFSNRTTFNFDTTSGCVSSRVYTPALGDGRNLAVTFQSSMMSTAEAMPTQSLNYAPLAIESEQISGYQVANLLRFAKSDGSLVNTSPLNDVEYAALVALVDGTSNLYAKIGNATTGTTIYATAGAIGSTAVGNMWLDTTGGHDVLKINTDSGIQSVVLATPGVGIGTSMLADGSVTSAKIADHTITGTDLDAGIVISTSGTISSMGVSTKAFSLSNSQSPVGTVNITAAAAAFTSYSLALPAATPAAGQVMAITDATTGQLGWVTPAAGALPSGNIFVGNSSGVATGVALSGDVSITNVGVAKVVGLQGVGIGTTVPISAGQVLRYDGTSKYQPAFLSMADIRSTTLPSATIFPTSSCGVGQALSWSSLTDQFGCTSIQLNASAINAGTIDAARLPATATNWSNNGTKIFNTGLTGFVGIGMSTPAYNLDVAGTINATSILVNGVAVGTGTSSPWLVSGANISNSNSGNVGIGTTSPSLPLSVNGNAQIGTATTQFLTPTSLNLVNAVTSAVAPQLNLVNLGGNFGSGSGIDFFTYDSPIPEGEFVSVDEGNWSAYLRLSTKIPGAATNALAERMRLTSAGKVGIGTTAPAYLLDVNGAVNATSILVNGVAVGSGGSNPWLTTGTTAYYNAGRVGIGTTTPASTLDVAGSIRPGNDITACSNTNVGAIRSNGASLENCDGTNWLTIGSGNSVGYVMPNDGGSVGQWGRVARVTVNIQYGGADFVYDLNSNQTYDLKPLSARIHVRYHIQEPLGPSAVMNGVVAVDSSSPLFGVEDVKFVITQNDVSASVAELWVRENLQYDAIHYRPALLNYYGASFDPTAGPLSTLPTGISQIAATSGVSPFIRNSNGDSILASGSVGIGTTAPGYKLDVAGAINATSLLVNGVAVGSGGSSPWAVYGTNIANLNSGNVGIGTTNPSSALEVNGNVTAGGFVAKAGSVALAGFGGEYGHGRFWVNDGVGTTQINLGPWNATDPNFMSLGTGLLIGNTGMAKSTVDISGNLTVGSGYAKVAAAPANGLIVQGNVGIGTTAPVQPLAVASTGTSAYLGIASFFAPNNAVTGNSSQINFGATASAGDNTEWRFVYQADNSGLNRTDFGFAGYAAPNISYLVNGNVGIGTTAPSQKLEVNGSLALTGGSGGGLIFADGTTQTTAASGTSQWVSDGTGINSNGSTVGIKTTASALKALTVGGDIELGGTNGGLLIDRASSTNSATVQFNTGGITNWLVGNSGDANFRIQGLFGTPGSIFINGATGNVGIGTTAPDAPLTVAGQMYSKLNAVTYAATTAIDFNTGNVQNVTLTGTTTFTFANGKAGAVYTVLLHQDSTGSWTATWPASVKWPGGSAPILSASGNALDVLTFVSDGTNFYNTGFATDLR